MLLDNPEFYFEHEQSTQENIAEQAKQTHTQEVTWNGYSSGNSLQMSQILCGIHCIDQIRHSSRKSQLATEEQHPTLGTNCHTGVFSRTVKSLVHALGTDSSVAEPTINST